MSSLAQKIKVMRTRFTIQDDKETEGTMKVFTPAKLREDLSILVAGIQGGWRGCNRKVMIRDQAKRKGEGQDKPVDNRTNWRSTRTNFMPKVNYLQPKKRIRDADENTASGKRARSVDE